MTDRAQHQVANMIAVHDVEIESLKCVIDQLSKKLATLENKTGQHFEVYDEWAHQIEEALGRPRTKL